MRTSRGMKIVALAAAGSLALAACSEPPADNGDKTGAGEFDACMVTDIGGIDDRSFNASAWAGLEAAAAENSNIKPKNVSSKDEADYEPNLQAYVDQDCDFILSVGGLMIDATKKIASANSAKQFAIVDGDTGEANVFPMQFDTAQAAFLAGYLAAGYSKSGKVATYGGLKIPPVTIFMDGFADGVKHYNQVKSANVEVLGWNKDTQEGTFAESFIDQAKGKALSDTFVAQGADVIMPVAGGTGLGTAAAAGEQYSVIWVDVDGCKSAEQYCSAFLTTVVKGMEGAVKDAALKSAGQAGTMVEGSFLGTLENGGVSLAPYNQFDSKVSAELKAEVEALKQEIISGAIKVESPAQPK